jgi:hypothetical protein
MLAAAACFFSSATVAQNKPPLSCYDPQFYLEKIDTPTGAVWIPEDDAIFETRLLPRELWEVEQPVELGGVVVLRPGDQLLTMRSRIPTKCNFPQLRDNGIAARQRICVFDPDGDGKFDRIYSRSRGGDIWFAMAWEHPKEGIQAIPAIAIKKIDSSQFKGGPKIKYYSDHIPLRRRPRDGSPPYYEAFTRALLYGNDGLRWYMTLQSPYSNKGLLNGTTVDFEGLRIKIEEVAAEKTLISYRGNFDRRVVDLPFLNSYERKCDTRLSRDF